MPKYFLAALVGSAIVTLATQPALAGVPKLKGTYSYHSFEICQIGLSFNKDGQGDVINLQPLGNNHIGTIVGAITFGGTATNSGTATFSAQKISGLPFKTNGTPSGGFSQGAESGSGNYSNTATTLTVDADTFVVSYSNILNGLARTVSFMIRSRNNTCFETGTLTRET